MNVKKFVALNTPIDEMSECAHFFFNWIIENYTVAGHVESWMLIVDMRDVGITQIPIGSLKGFLSSM